jgi:hypothetical protein
MDTDDLGTLREFVLRLAGQLLREGGQLEPFAASLSQTGVPAAIVSTSASSARDRGEQIALLTAALLRETTTMQLRAVGLCCSDRLPDTERRDEDPAVEPSGTFRNGDRRTSPSWRQIGSGPGRVSL